MRPEQRQQNNKAALTTQLLYKLKSANMFAMKKSFQKATK